MLRNLASKDVGGLEVQQITEKLALYIEGIARDISQEWLSTINMLLAKVTHVPSFSLEVLASLY